MQNKLIYREIQKNIENWLFKDKVLTIYGARQVGKTTLAKEILKKHGNPRDYFNCEILAIRQALEKENPVQLRNFLGTGKLIVLDEAQKVKNIGLILKLFHDTYPETQILATGSSSFDLANKINEPLTGRALEFTLYPLSLRELKDIYQNFELEGQMDNFLIFGLYPEIVKADMKNAARLLDNLSEKYLYKDILSFSRIKKPNLLVGLLQLLALQIGQEVSVHELAVKLQCSRDTIINYLDILEKSFIIVRLRAYSRNQRNEIGKKQKIYFMDLGIRNSLVSRYQPINLRDDVGALWENFCVVERLKKLQVENISCQIYFWRNLAQREVDYVEEFNDSLNGYEFKWNKDKFIAPKDFLRYKNSRVVLVNRKNYMDFLF